MNLLILLSFLLILVQCEAYRVLLCFSIPVRSLNILGKGIAKHLIDAGHEVTFITTYPPREKLKNLDVIDLSSIQGVFEGDDVMNIEYILEQKAIDTDISYLHNKLFEVAEAVFKHENVQRILDKSQHFDVVIADYMDIELYSAFAALYDCPMVWAYSMGAHWVPLRLIEGPTNPAYSIDFLIPHMPPFTFTQRFDLLWSQIKWTFIKEFSTLPKEEEIYKQFFGPLFSARGRVLPKYQELIYNASLILANEHHALGDIPSTPQNFKFIGGLHIESHAKPLPQDLQTLMDNAKHGVIYFSMGSTWKSKDISPYIKQNLLNMFGELKQTVIWKHEKPLDNVPKNVHIVHWAPQPSILAHRNCLLFISHGGLLSSTEAIHYGVPIIGVPIYFDQFININKAVQKGYALTAELSVHWADNLRKPIQMMLTDHRYRAKAKELSKIYHDRALPPHRELIYSVEHVIRTNGAPHLRSPALRVPLYQKLYLDLIVVVFFGLLVVYKVLMDMCRSRRGQIKMKRS